MTATIANAHPDLEPLAKRLTDDDVLRAEVATTLLAAAKGLIEEAVRLATPFETARCDDVAWRRANDVDLSDEAFHALRDLSPCGRLSDLAFEIRSSLESIE